MECFTSVIDEFAKRGDLEVLADKVENALVFLGESGGEYMIHDVGVVYADGGISPGVGEVDGGLGGGEEFADT